MINQNSKDKNEMTALSYDFCLFNDLAIIIFQLYHMVRKYNYYLKRLHDDKIRGS